MSVRSAFCAAGILIAILFTSNLRADDVQLGATFVCNGEPLYVENCNIRDRSDSATCMVAHPDRPQKNGLMVYTYETRGSLKKLLPTCKQPSADEVRKANDFQRMQSQKLAANVKKANEENDEIDAKAEAVINGSGHALSAEEREMYRCITAGRASDLCTGKIFSNFLSSSINMLLPGAVHDGEPGLSLAGRYEGCCRIINNHDHRRKRGTDNQFRFASTTRRTESPGQPSLRFAAQQLREPPREGRCAGSRGSIPL